MANAVLYHPNLVVSPSKALSLLFTHMRDTRTPSVEFVHYAKRAMRLVAEDALAEFPCQSVTISTPCTPAYECTTAMNPAEICAVSIVRSGDAFLEVIREVAPAVSVGKILIQRDESSATKAANIFYSKLPTKIAQQHVLLCDPMLATGGSAMRAIETLCAAGVDPKRVVFATMICAPEGLKVLGQIYPQIKIVTACVDRCLNSDKYIVPGLGDYGDRFFNTTD